MITRFFSASKPIHLVIILSLTAILFFVVKINALDETIEISHILRIVLFCLVLLFSIVVLAFFVTKNNLTQRNSYKILFYFLLLFMLPSSMLNSKVILASFFIMLALRRIISIRTKRNVKKKIFDAAFWIGIASLFYFWSFLFFGLLLAALFLYSIESLKNWVIPLLGLITVAILTVSYSIIFTGSIGSLSAYIDGLSYDFTVFNNLKLIIPITLVFSLGFWALIYYVKSLKDQPKLFRASHLLIIYAAIIAVIIIAVANNKNGSEFIFLFGPLSVIMSNYIQIVKERWFAEVYVWLFLITPIGLLLL